jgi:hypothetical protein
VIVKLSLTFCEYPWALTIVKNEAKFIMNQTSIDHKAYKWEGSYAYSSIVGGFIHLQVCLMSLPSLRSRYNIPPNFMEGNSWI